MSEDLVERLWQQARVSLAAKVAVLRCWERGEVDDRAAREITHQLVGTLGSYHRRSGAAAAGRLDALLRAHRAHRRGGPERDLIDLIERVVRR